MVNESISSEQRRASIMRPKSSMSSLLLCSDIYLIVISKNKAGKISANEEDMTIGLSKR